MLRCGVGAGSPLGAKQIEVTWIVLVRAELLAAEPVSSSRGALPPQPSTCADSRESRGGVYLVKVSLLGLGGTLI